MSALLVAVTLAAPAREVRLLMGTTASVSVAGLAEPDRALHLAFAALERVDAAMSLWSESELTRLNRAGGGPVSPELAAVLCHALDVAEASEGAFDPTVEPLVRAGGGLGGGPRALGWAERKRLLARVGWRRVRLDAGWARLEPGTTLDLGGIAKGFASDQALAELRRAGASAGLVDLGGSSLALFGDPETLEVRDPDGGGAAWAVFRVSTGAVASSGGDQKPGHILDPRTGLPARGLLAATVVAATGIEADALSTAVYVLGAERGLRLLKHRGAGGFVLLRESGRATIRATSGFAAEHALRARPGVEVLE